MTKDELLAEALKLSDKDRDALAHELYESVVRTDELDDYWKAEIQRRVQEIENGTAVLIDESEALRKIFEPLDE